MPETPVILQEYWTIQFQSAHEEVRRAFDGLSDEQIFFQPSPDTNSMAWLAWHLYRWQDEYTAMPHGDTQVWVSGGWAERFGIPPERGGVGDTPEQVAAFRPARKLLMGYIEAVHEAAVSRVRRLADDQLATTVAYDPTEGTVPFWFGLIRMFNDSIQHTGQITYLRGLITGLGWKQTLDWASLRPEG